ncbi:MAG: ABC transporter permease [Acidobacteria bacterium]|nr:ABC transporter permease [Acidobacteriota bacterium]
MTATLDLPVLAAPEPAPVRRRYRALRRFARNRAAFIGALVLVALVVVAVFAPLIAPHDPYHQDLLRRFQPPGRGGVLGSDDFGRDQLSRLIFGARASLIFSLLAMAVAVIIGLPQGLAAGFLGGKVDTALGRLNDTLLAVPAILLAIVVVGALGPSLVNASFAVGLVTAPRFFRIVRAVTQDVKGETYIEASRALGSTTRRTVLHDVVPNVLGPLIVQFAIGLGTAVTAEASLSFIGLGIRPPTASWGGMLQMAAANMTQAPFLVYPPGIMIAITVMAYLMVGDGLRTAFGTTRSAVSEGTKA